MVEGILPKQKHARCCQGLKSEVDACSHLDSVLHCVLPNVRHVHCWQGIQRAEVQLLQLATQQAACICLVVGANVG